MAKTGARDLTVGVTAALALAILALAVMSVGNGSAVFRSRTIYHVVFQSSDGLVVGSPVKIAGVQVGTVESIELPTNPEDRGIHVTVGVDQRYSARVREDSEAALRILQLLSGEKFVEISPGSAERPARPANSEIPTLTDPEFFEQGADIAENLQQITVSLKEILDPIVRGEGLLGELIANPDFGKDGLARLKGTLENLESLTGQITEGRGFVGRALYDPQFEARIDTLGEAMDRFASLVGKMDEEGGTVSTLLAADGPMPQAIDDLRVAAASLRKVSSSLEKETGLIGRLLHDEAWSEELAEDLRGVTGDLRAITGRIESGEGTLGQLVNERTLHDGLEQVVAGVGDSKFARWLLRHYRKKGVELDQEELKALGIEER